MARDFAGTDGPATIKAFGTVGLQVTLTMPFTMCSWINPDVVSNNNAVIAQTDLANNQRFLHLYNTSNTMNAYHQDGTGGAAEASAPGTGVVGEWSHCATVFSGTTLRRAYLNGVGGSDNFQGEAPPITTTFSIGGAITNSGLASNMQIGHVAIWNIALDLRDIASLASGINPLRLKMESLQHYWPINRLSGGEIDIIGGFSLPEINGPLPYAEEPSGLMNSIIAP